MAAKSPLDKMSERIQGTRSAKMVLASQLFSGVFRVLAYAKKTPRDIIDS